MTQLRNCPIALPPLAEQKRIVAQVERLLGRCDELKAGLVAGEGLRGRVVESVLWHGVSGVKG